MLIRSALLFAALAPVLAQSPEMNEPPLLRSTTRLIQVDVTVRDKAGRPVEGLKEGDFEVFEDGKRQTVRFFNGSTDGFRRTEPLMEGMATNRPETGGGRRGVTVVLVDSLNTDWNSRQAAREGLRRFLLSARPDDRLAVYTLAGDLKVVHDYTSDAASLLRQLDKKLDTPNPADSIEQLRLLSQMIPQAAALVKWSTAHESDFRTAQQASATFEALEAIARHVGGTPGRKSLVWISSGFPMSIQNNRDTGVRTRTNGTVITGATQSFAEDFERAHRALSNANVAVFPINPKGLETLPEFDAISQVGVARRDWRSSNSTLHQVAERTGGREFTDQNGIAAALRTVSEEAQKSYTLAYYPTSHQYDGRYRKIEVKLKRDGLTASHRQGYYAWDEAAVSKVDVKEELLAAAREPLDASVVGIDGLLRERQGAAGHEVLARIDASELLWQEGGKFQAGAGIALVQFGAEGRQLAGVTDNVSFQVDAAKAAALGRYGIRYQRALELKPGVARVRLVVRSAKTGAVGSLTLPLK